MKLNFLSHDLYEESFVVANVCESIKAFDFKEQIKGFFCAY